MIGVDSFDTLFDELISVLLSNASDSNMMDRIKESVDTISSARNLS